MVKYDALGQDTFAFISSDHKVTGAGINYIEITKIADASAGIIIIAPTGVFQVSGEIYKKYVALNRWDGPLGYPVMDEASLNAKSGRYSGFAKSGSVSTGQIYWNSATGAQAFWGKMFGLYGNAGYDASWLGLPTTSCDMNKSDANQAIKFQQGSIEITNNCGKYKSATGHFAFSDGRNAEVQWVANGVKGAIVDSSDCY